MNTAALKRFAQKARTILMEGVANRLLYWGFNEKGDLINNPPEEVLGGIIYNEMLIDDPTAYKKWKALQIAIRQHGISHVAEEVAYTWFNRMMAIRILAKNGYIAPQLEFESEQITTPIIISKARRNILPAMDADQRRLLAACMRDDTHETELFTLLLAAYCRENVLLNQVFGRLDDYTELLLPANILSENGFIWLLNTTDAITDEEYRQVELIGWLYQFYISEKKDEVFRSFKNKKKAEAEDIPAATQIFTPNWIVKYMVQNTVGRLWLDLNPDSDLRADMKYLVENPDAPQTDNPLVSEVSQIKLLDPACGSGHILVEGFDLLFDMYREEGYSKREAVQHILRNNLYGLELDKRAAQLATFAILLKAAQHDRSALETLIMPHIYPMPEPYNFEQPDIIDFLEGDTIYLKPLTKALDLMQDAQNLGSIMKFDFSEEMRETLMEKISKWENTKATNIFMEQTVNCLIEYIRIMLLLTMKYEAVAANPPYMRSKHMNISLKKYVNAKYIKGKADLFAVFMEVSMRLCIKEGRMAMINMHSWMFLSFFEVLRKWVIDNFQIENMLHLGARAFDEMNGEVVQNTAFVLKNNESLKEGIYIRLVDGSNSLSKEKDFFNKNNKYKTSQLNFKAIPGEPIVYWIKENVIKLFELDNICNNSFSSPGVRTGKDSIFIRDWYEVSLKKFKWNATSAKDIKSTEISWYPITRGGEFRKWYGNLTSIINLKNDAYDIKTICDDYRLREPNYYFKEGLTWTMISSYSPSFRFIPVGILFGNGGPCLYSEDIYFYLGLLNSKTVNFLLKLINPTLNITKSDIGTIPLISALNTGQISQQNITISRIDWDSRETSWDFQQNELIRQATPNLTSAYETYTQYWSQQFRQLHANEVELNRIFINLYGLQDELTPEVKLKDITILQDELDSNQLGEYTEPEQLPDGNLPFKTGEVIAQFISYAIGCLMGRYRLDQPGLYIAHPNPTAEETAPYTYNGHEFHIDDDGIIPLMDSQCSFADNALNRVKYFVETIWGEETLVENLNFINNALGKDLENWLMKDFWPLHCRRYQKRPIYWQFASPGGAFRILVYMHRMNKFTVEKIRSNYLLKHIRNLDNRITILSADSAALGREQQRELEKQRKDLLECQDYDLLIKDFADRQLDFDLDDGVVVNHQKFAGIATPIK